MSLDFLDVGLPVESDNDEKGSEEITAFRGYCKLLHKSAGQLTKKELETYYKEREK